MGCFESRDRLNEKSKRSSVTLSDASEMDMITHSAIPNALPKKLHQEDKAHNRTPPHHPTDTRHKKHVKMNVVFSSVITTNSATKSSSDSQQPCQSIDLEGESRPGIQTSPAHRTSNESQHILPATSDLKSSGQDSFADGGGERDSACSSAAEEDEYQGNHGKIVFVLEGTTTVSLPVVSGDGCGLMTLAAPEPITYQKKQQQHRSSSKVQLLENPAPGTHRPGGSRMPHVTTTLSSSFGEEIISQYTPSPSASQLVCDGATLRFPNVRQATQN